MYPVIQVSVLVTARFISLDRVLPCKGKGEVVSMLTPCHYDAVKESKFLAFMTLVLHGHESTATCHVTSFTRKERSLPTTEAG